MVTTFANGLQGIEAQALTGAGTTTFVTLPDGTPIAETTPTGAYYYITDNQGSVIGLADPNGTPRTGLIHLGDRYYNPNSADGHNPTPPARPPDTSTLETTRSMPETPVEKLTVSIGWSGSE